ncbi:MAG: murein biosynthesis integral membrane protein MurJ [Gammaproteobacteria bacterium]|nr:murein biosynthesis integral membrane protein MurJ [Gammaproteobacteria bacterium]
MTLVSRISGLVRDMLFASLIGAGVGVAADAFYVAFRIPNFLRRIFGEGAFSQSFVPVFTEYKTKYSAEEARVFVDHMTGILGVILFGVTLAGVIAAPILVMVLAPGFLDEPHKYHLTVQMLRITFPYLLFISLVAMAAGVLNTYGRFGAAAFTPVLLNLSMIGAAVWLAPRMQEPVVALAWGVFIAGVVQLLFQVPFLRGIKMLPRPRLHLRERHDGVARVFKLMLPAIFGVSISQINMLVNTLLASFLVTGSVSWLYYSDRLMEFPLGVFGIALATVILPSLARRHARNSHEEFSHMLDWGLRWVCLIGIPASVALIILSVPLLMTLFHFGAFGANDVRMSANALMAFALGLLAFIMIKVLAPGFYARQDTKTPMRIGVVSLVVNIVLSLLLVIPLKHVGLALAISISAFVNAGLLFLTLRRHKVYRPLPGWGFFLARIFIASAVMGAILFWGVGDFDSWLHASAMHRAYRLSIWVVVGVLVYLLTVSALGVRLAQLLLKKGVGTQTDD